MKTCNKCGETKPLAEFHALKTARDGLYPTCKVCRIARESGRRKRASERLQARKKVLKASRLGNRVLPERSVSPNSEQICWGCREVLPLERFAVLTGRKTDRTNYCHPCRSSLRENKPWFLYKYGISQLDYQALFEKQQGRCAICGTDNPPVNKRGVAWHLDHCHRTGRVRGILCHRCNVGLGVSKMTLGSFLVRHAIWKARQPPACSQKDDDRRPSAAGKWRAIRFVGSGGVQIPPNGLRASWGLLGRTAPHMPKCTPSPRRWNARLQRPCKSAESPSAAGRHPNSPAFSPKPSVRRCHGVADLAAPEEIYRY